MVLGCNSYAYTGYPQMNCIHRKKALTIQFLLFVGAYLSIVKFAVGKSKVFCKE